MVVVVELVLFLVVVGSWHDGGGGFVQEGGLLL